AELLGRLAGDRALLAATFGGVADAGQVVRVTPGLSDPHGRGRTVCFVHFDSGLEVVYKPRAVGIERSYAALVAWLDGRGLQPPLRAAGTLERGDYGWAERIHPTPCADATSARDFYRRAGALVCLMDVLGAVDLHYGNLVACGADPVPVDLETLFHPGPARDSTDADPEAAGSVLRTGLLPHWIPAADDRSYDVSGLGAVSPRTTTLPRLAWRDADTDVMELEVEPTPIPRLANGPTLAGRELSPADFRSEIISGFASAYRLLASHASDLATADGPLADMQGRRTRVLFRHTVTYRRWMEESLAPECLRNGALRRTRMQARLASPTRVDAARDAWLRSAELEALLRLDVPHFSTRPGEVFLEEAGGERIDDWFERPRLDSVAEHLARMDEADLERRLQILAATLDLSRLERLMHRG
ncbi:MAG: type 2 lanthipeptide synthetase LanM, partial [Gemmatimonadales bacterium]